MKFQSGIPMNFHHGLILFTAALLTVAGANSAESIGFFSPQGVTTEMVAKTNLALINVYNPAQMKKSLEMVDGHPFVVNLDFGPTLATIQPARQLKREYVTLDGKKHWKQLTALSDNKIRVLPSNKKIRTLLKPYLPIMQTYSKNIGTVFLVDEPYLNGVSKGELERAGKEVRKLFNAHRLSNVKLGVIFASAMFNRDFAIRMNRAAGDYALAIDNHYQHGGRALSAAAKEEWHSWKVNIKTRRLTTYDTAGNMYTGGGLPKQFDVVGFDFYLSTMLLDGVHDKTLDWLSTRYPEECGNFKGTSMRELRKRLSFFQDGPVLQGNAPRESDRTLLDFMFTCRMTAAVDLLNKEIAKTRRQGRQVQALLISESSNNGVLEFDSAGNIENNQPEKLNESRVYDEVMRALRLYRNAPSNFPAGLLFFTYQDEYDKSIKLNIGGAKNMPGVMREISIHR